MLNKLYITKNYIIFVLNPKYRITKNNKLSLIINKMNPFLNMD